MIPKRPSTVGNVWFGFCFCLGLSWECVLCDEDDFKVDGDDDRSEHGGAHAKEVIVAAS